MKKMFLIALASCLLLPCIVQLQAQVTDANGALPGEFSVSKTQKVRCSQGNLQYQPSTDTWRFAEHQWDFCGKINTEAQEDKDRGKKYDTWIKPDYEGWIDAFCWGNGAEPLRTAFCNYHLEYDPVTATEEEKKKTGMFGLTYRHLQEIFRDWAANAISNGGNKENLWRTLSNEEWIYLLTKRKDAAKKWGVACVNNVNGLILLPDNWTLPEGVIFNPKGAKKDDVSLYRAHNDYSAEQWAKMEQAGAIFLPACSLSWNAATKATDYMNHQGYYWSKDLGVSTTEVAGKQISNIVVYALSFYPRRFFAPKYGWGVGAQNYSVRAFQDVK